MMRSDIKVACGIKLQKDMNARSGARIKNPSAYADLYRALV
jgi:hypothetical protein